MNACRDVSGNPRPLFVGLTSVGLCAEIGGLECPRSVWHTVTSTYAEYA